MHNSIFKQGGALPYFYRELTVYLNCKVSPWVGGGGTISCTSQSPDLTPMGSYLWDYIYDNVFVLPIPKIADISEMDNTNSCHCRCKHIL